MHFEYKEGISIAHSLEAEHLMRGTFPRKEKDEI